MLFIESPAFVGFSYSNTSSDSVVGDWRTTMDCVEFMRRFVEIFPQFRDRELWVTGESYGGHYVPLLTEALLNNTATADVYSIQGFMVGNPYSDAASDNVGELDFLTQHYLMPNETANAILEACDIYDIVWPLSKRAERLSADEQADACDAAFEQAYRDMGAVSVYDVYEDVCIPDRAVGEQLQMAKLQSRSELRRRGHGPLAHALLAAHLTREQLAATAPHLLQSRLKNARPDPCIDSEVATWLNRPDVQAAMHANVTGAVPGPWSFCTDRVDYNLTDAVASMNVVYERLLQRRNDKGRDGKVRLVVYSGTIDASCPTAGTFRWLKMLEDAGALKVKKHWSPWQMPSGQTGGHWIRYEGLDMVMVRGAGHMVPYIKPERALHMFSALLAGRTL